jgi:hypothetical protein
MHRTVLIVLAAFTDLSLRASQKKALVRRLPLFGAVKRVQNVSKTRGESGAFERMPVNDRTLVTISGSNSCYQKSRAITDLKRRVERIRSP